jgi:NADH:ubiquinone reductase (H+-translocating)
MNSSQLIQERMSMNRVFRRALIGFVAGALAGAALAPALTHPLLAVLLGGFIGACYSASLKPTRGTYIDNLMAGGALGIPLWGLVSVVALPLLSGHMPEWNAEQMRSHFPVLVGWVTYGGLLGLLTQGLSDLAASVWGPEVDSASLGERQKTRVVILGGGFAGMHTAECLEEQFRTHPDVELTLVSETNALLFTPMLAEVAGSSLEPTHISTPLRSALHRTEFIRGRIAKIDLDNRRVSLSTERAAEVVPCDREISYDHLVFALGAVSNYLGMANLQKFSFNFKSLLDAIRIRNHVIEMFERADREPDAAQRRALLTFVIAGGGFAGAELAGALNDYAHGILADYPKLCRKDLSVILVHSRDRILPELSDSLGRYAQERMEARGVIFRLNTRLTDAGPGKVTLSDGEIRAETLVWTAGTAPNPLVQSLPLEKDKRRALVVERTLAIPGKAGLWALGDCAAVVDARTEQPCPPTAQFALREARILARNIRAQIEGRALTPFHFDSLGSLCVVGHQTACAELTVPFARSKSMRFSGLLAWLMWRGIYLSKLPGLERKIRVLTDWVVELFFPRDIVQTIELK